MRRRSCGRGRGFHYGDQSGRCPYDQPQVCDRGYVQVPLDSKKFGRIATQNAKNVILQKIREEERKALYNDYYSMEKDVATGIVQRYLGRNISINLGKVDAILNESEQVKGETFRPTERIKVYILEVKDTTKAPGSLYPEPIRIW